MEITEFTFRLIIVGIPGIITYFLLSKLIGRVGKNSIEIVLLIFLFSILSYSLYNLFASLICNIVGLEYSNDIVNKLFKKADSVKYNDILWTSFVAVILSFVISYLHRYNILNWVGQKIGATKKYGDEDVWHYFHNASDKQKNDGWIFIRDHKLNLLYYGYISVWSESEKNRELVITDVTVYNNEDGEYLYDTNHLYICRNIDDISIEVPIIKKEDSNNGR